MSIPKDSAGGDGRAPQGEASGAAGARPLDRLGRRLLLPAVLALLALVTLALVSDVRQLAGKLRTFDLGLVPAILALSLVNYALRFGRWQLYLGAVGTRLPWRRSLGVFLVGFALSVTPGKAGELGKAWLVRELGGGEARRVVAVVLCERLTDLLATLALMSLGALRTPAGAWLAAGGLGVCVASVVLLSWHGGARRVLGLLSRLPWMGARTAVLVEVHERLRRLLRPVMLLPAVAMAAVAWGAEGLGFGIVVRSYAPGSSWLAGIFDYCFSTLVGAISMLPGGLLATEGSLAAVLGLRGLDTAAAAAAALVTRAATLWFAVLLGLLALPVVLRQLRRHEP